MSKKEVFYLSICIFLSVIAWLIADVHHASTTRQLQDGAEIPHVRQYTINTKLLERLEEKVRK